MPHTPNIPPSARVSLSDRRAGPRGRPGAAGGGQGPHDLPAADRRAAGAYICALGLVGPPPPRPSAPRPLPTPCPPNPPTNTHPQLFLDAHLLTHRANRVALLAATPERSAFLYPPPHTPSNPTPTEGKGHPPAPADEPAGAAPAAPAAVADRVGQAVVEGLKRLLAAPPGGLGQQGGEEGQGQGQQPGQQPRRRRQGSMVAQALSTGLCCECVGCMAADPQWPWVPCSPTNLYTNTPHRQSIQTSSGPSGRPRRPCPRASSSSR